MVVLVNPYDVGHAYWVMLCKDSSTRITFFLGIVPIRFIAVKLQVQLSCLHFCLLQAKKVCSQRLKGFGKPFAYTRPKAIYVPADKFQVHLLIMYGRCVLEARNGL